MTAANYRLYIGEYQQHDPLLVAVKCFEAFPPSSFKLVVGFVQLAFVTVLEAKLVPPIHQSHRRFLSVSNVMIVRLSFHGKNPPRMTEQKNPSDLLPEITINQRLLPSENFDFSNPPITIF